LAGWRLKEPQNKACGSSLNPLDTRMWNIFLFAFMLAENRLPPVRGCASGFLQLFHVRA
jgi:hypothetical protein